MKEIIINIPEDSSALVTELIEKLGGSIKTEEKKTIQKKANPKPTFSFGKWKDADIDARKLREELWTRKF